MRIEQSEYGTKMWASTNDTYDWAERPGNRWPCSTIRGRSLFIEHDRNGDLVDLVINGGKGSQDVDGHELNAFIEDALKGVKS